MRRLAVGTVSLSLFTRIGEGSIPCSCSSCPCFDETNKTSSHSYFLNLTNPNPNPNWVITNSQQVRDRMDRMQAMRMRPDEEQQTYDFATMYTQLKLFAEGADPDAPESREVLDSKMQSYVDLVFDHVKHTVKPYGEEKALEAQSWGRSQKPWKQASASLKDKDRVKFVTRERLMKWIRYLLNHLYVQVGDSIMRQIVGVPMGTSCSPFLANLTLFMFEFEWFSQQISQLRPWHLRKREQLWRLSYCTRYIDDLWNPLVRESEFTAMAARIYPEWLQLGEPEFKGQEINYLDMRIKYGTDTSAWSSRLYDKKEAMILKGLKLNKFPHPESLLSSRCKYGVITSQLHRFNVACSSLQAFLEPATKLYSTYLSKGYARGLTDRYFTSFLRRHVPECSPTMIQRRYSAQ